MADFVLELVDLQNILCGTFDLLSIHNAVHDKCVVMSAACRYHSTNIVICWWANFHLWIMTSPGDNCSTTIHDTPSYVSRAFHGKIHLVLTRDKNALLATSVHFARSFLAMQHWLCTAFSLKLCNNKWNYSLLIREYLSLLVNV